MRVKRVVIDKANRLFQLPPEVSSFFRNQKRPTLMKKTRMLDLASFNWPLRFVEDIEINPSKLAPASETDLSELAEELAEWLSGTYSVRILPRHELFVGGSVSTSVLNLALALIDQGDLVLVPDLAVPLYRSAVAAAGGQPVFYQLESKNGFKPDIERINPRVGRVARFLFLNNPHNPSGAELSQQDLEFLVYFASRENIAIINDAAYQSIPDRGPSSLLSVTGGKRVGAEVFSFAYLLGLPNIGLGFVAGNREIVSALRSSSRLSPTYFPLFYVDLVRRAMRQYPSKEIKDVRRMVNNSSHEAGKLMDLLSLEKFSLDNTPFIWAKITRRGRASNAASILYRRSRIMTTPGTAFGESGEGFLRFSLTAPAQDYQEACSRVKSRRPFVTSEKTE